MFRMFDPDNNKGEGQHKSFDKIKTKARIFVNNSVYWLFRYQQSLSAATIGIVYTQF